jgi:DnaJ family protein C protein 28
MKVVDEIISQAIRDGHFDNLPGEGRPLPAEADPRADPSQAVLFRLLREQGFSLPWIELGNQIQDDLGEARSRLRQRRDWLLGRGHALERSPSWRQALADFRGRCAELNRMIAELNLVVPHPRFQRPAIDPETEIAAVG